MGKGGKDHGVGTGTQPPGGIAHSAGIETHGNDVVLHLFRTLPIVEAWSPITVVRVRPAHHRVTSRYTLSPRVQPAVIKPCACANWGTSDAGASGSASRLTTNNQTSWFSLASLSCLAS